MEDIKYATTKIIAGGENLLKDASEHMSKVFKDLGFEDLTSKISEKFKPYTLKSTKTETIIEFNFAGYAKEGIKVQIDEKNGTLTIKGVRTTEGGTETLSQTFKLRNGVTAKSIKSSYRHGLLTVTIQKPNLNGTQDIPVD